MKNAEWHAKRRLGIGGSDANIIMSGDADRINDLAREKRGEIEPSDLSDVLPVQMGVTTEPFNRFWFSKQTGRMVERDGEMVVKPDMQFMRATLDGMTDANTTYFEAKHLNAFTNEDDALPKYIPQLTHCMLVCGVEKAVISMFFGTMKWVAVDVSLDPLYAAQLIDAEKRFWDCVISGETPVPVNVLPPVKAIRKVSFEGNNAWSSAAHTWRSNRGYAKSFDSAAKELKGMVDADVMEATGHGIVIARSKNGALTIRETE